MEPYLLQIQMITDWNVFLGGHHVFDLFLGVLCALER